MSSKRGRKRNDNLPPNRARDVQRAFRQRRSEHLRAMEERVSELEEENDRLRAALNMPPANRVPLGKGPTGKDKPKPYKNAVTGLSRATSADSGVSTRATSISPTSHANSLQTSPQSLETGQWIGGNADDVKSELSPGQNNNNNNNNHGGGGGSGPFAQQSSLPSSFPNSSTGTPTYAQSPVSPSFAQSSTPNTPYGQQSAGPFSMSSSAAQKAPSPWAQLSSSSRSNLSSGAVYLPQSYTSGADSPGGMNNYPRSYLDPNTAYHPSASMTTPSHDPNTMHGGGGNPHPASLQALVHPPPSGAASTMASNLSFAPPARRQVDGAQAFRPLPNHQLFISSQPQHLSSLPPPRDEASAARNA